MAYPNTQREELDRVRLFAVGAFVFLAESQTIKRIEINLFLHPFLFIFSDSFSLFAHPSSKIGNVLAVT